MQEITLALGGAVILGNSMAISVVEVRGKKVRLGIDAPREISVGRQERYSVIKVAAADTAMRNVKN